MLQFSPAVDLKKKKKAWIKSERKKNYREIHKKGRNWNLSIYIRNDPF